MPEYKYPGYGPTRENWLTSRPKPIGGYHRGNDNPAPAGTPVYAQYDGKVFRSGNINGYGLAVVVQSEAPDGTKFYTLYGHLAPQDLPAPDTPIVAGKPIPGALIGTKEDVQRLGGLSSGPHLHREIISGKAKLEQDPNKPFGIYSSDIKYKADPDAFDINNPVFPYEHNEPKPTPKPAPTTSARSPQLQLQPSRPGSAQQSQSAPQPAAPIFPQQSGEPNPRAQPGATAPPAQRQPSRSGLPLDITPQLAPGTPNQGAAAPAPDGLPPLHFAPETPQRFGPFEMPGLLRSDALGSPGVAPAADGTGTNPSLPPTPSFGAPGATAPATSPAASGMAGQIGDGNGIGDWWKSVASAASSNVDPSFRGLNVPVPNNVPTSPPLAVFDSGLPGMLQRAGAFDPPAGGLLGLLQELSRNHPDDDDVPR
jgi:hypothetical protein